VKETAMMKYARPWIILFVIASCATLRGGALRDLSADREYTIVVQRVLDARLPSLTEEQFQDMLDKLKGYIHEHLGYRVSFLLKGNKDLLKFTREMAYAENLPVMKELKKSLLDENNPDDAKRFREYLTKLISSTPEPILKTYVPRYSSYRDRADLVERLYTEYLKKLRLINSIRTKDGTALKSSAYAATLTYPFWDTALRELRGAHFIFSNTVMADLEVDIPIYVVLRYGITTGMVEANAHSEYGGAGVIFTYPFIARDGFFMSEREEQIPPEMLTDVIALYSTHEFGHLLNHYKDYYDHKNCMMVPANDLNYFRWYRERKEKKCELPHEKLKSF
jgi:hypothetical protein